LYSTSVAAQPSKGNLELLPSCSVTVTVQNKWNRPEVKSITAVGQLIKGEERGKRKAYSSFKSQLQC